MLVKYTRGETYKTKEVVIEELKNFNLSNSNFSTVYTTVEIRVNDSGIRFNIICDFYPSIVQTLGFNLNKAFKEANDNNRVFDVDEAIGKTLNYNNYKHYKPGVVKFDMQPVETLKDVPNELEQIEKFYKEEFQHYE